MPHDLSFNAAKLDLDALEDSLRHGVGMARRAVERAMSEHQDACFGSSENKMMYSAKSLFDAAQSLFIISHSLHYVSEARERENVTFERGEK